MAVNFIARAQTVIKAPSNKVWEALTSPQIIKAFLFGAEVKSQWKDGSPIEFYGQWEGESYHDKGIIQRFEPPNLLQYSHYSSLSQLDDIEGNYSSIMYELSEENQTTLVTLRQENLANDYVKARAEDYWHQVLNNLKEVVERQPQLA